MGCGASGPFFRPRETSVQGVDDTCFDDGSFGSRPTPSSEMSDTAIVPVWRGDLDDNLSCTSVRTHCTNSSYRSAVTSFHSSRVYMVPAQCGTIPDDGMSEAPSISESNANMEDLADLDIRIDDGRESVPKVSSSGGPASQWSSDSPHSSTVVIDNQPHPLAPIITRDMDSRDEDATTNRTEMGSPINFSENDFRSNCTTPVSDIRLTFPSPGSISRNSKSSSFYDLKSPRRAHSDAPRRKDSLHPYGQVVNGVLQIKPPLRSGSLGAARPGRQGLSANQFQAHLNPRGINFSLSVITRHFPG